MADTDDTNDVQTDTNTGDKNESNASSNNSSRSSDSGDVELTRTASPSEVEECATEIVELVGGVNDDGTYDENGLAPMSNDDLNATMDNYFKKHGDEVIPKGVNRDDYIARVKTAVRDARDNAVMHKADPDPDKGDFKPFENVDFNDKDPDYVAEGSIDNDDPNVKKTTKAGGVNDLTAVPIDSSGTILWVWKDDEGNVHRSGRKPKVDAANTSGEGGTGETPVEESPATIEEKLTNFERVGIKGDRTAATRPASEWEHIPGAKEDTRQKFDCLADAINFDLKLLHKTPDGKGNTLEGQGFVNRAIPDYHDKSFLDQVVELAFETSGAGSSETQLAQVMSRHDRFGRSLVTKNAVLSGYTFFTRPRLCLRDWNICHDRKLATLMTTDVLSMPFAIRCLLDTRFAKEDANASKCPLFDPGNPFLVPLCNAVRSVSGFNDPVLVTETTEGGFFSEDQTYVIGGDRMSRTYDINCMFREYPGSPVLATIDYWTQFMAGLTDGSLQQYADAIDLNRMDYTVSIYRFLMDRTNRHIVRWAKCTGCYPVSPPSGVAFNLNEGEFLVEAAATINVPFKANRIEYDDPVILKEFNMLVRRYAGDDTGLTGGGSRAAFAHNVASNNFSGIPYIRMAQNSANYELIWLKRDMVGEYISGKAQELAGIFATSGAYRENGVVYRGSSGSDPDQDVKFLL